MPDNQKDKNAVALGKKGAAKGGKARAEKLSPERRSEIASNAAKKRWEMARESTANASVKPPAPGDELESNNKADRRGSAGMQS